MSQQPTPEGAATPPEPAPVQPAPSQKFCSECGNPRQGDEEICLKCGTSLSRSDSSAQDTTAAPVVTSTVGDTATTQSVVVNVAAPAVAASAPMIAPPSGPNIILRLFYFVFIGWWLGGFVSLLAWFLNATVIGLPLGLWLTNRLPTVITLRPQEQNWQIKEGVLVKGKDQLSFLVRALYFVFIGWWFSAVWLVTAYLLLLIIIGLPLAFWMYGRVGAITTLYRS